MKAARAEASTRDRLLDAAQRLMLAKGFAATTVDEICEAAKLTKGSFFHYFQSKDHLGRELLERFCCSAEQLHAGFCGNESDPLKRVFCYIDAMTACARDPLMSRGCLLGTFAHELSDTHPQIRSACAKGFKAWAEQFAKQLAAAKAAHPPRTPFDSMELAEHLIAVVEGALILGKAQRDPAALERSLRHFRAYVGSLFGR
jgi:TetR/AcrR family transcriptional repressor of nem operon